MNISQQFKKCQNLASFCNLEEISWEMKIDNKHCMKIFIMKKEIIRGTSFKFQQ